METSTLTCTKCGQFKTSDEMPRDRRNKSGFSSWCRECHNGNARRWRDKQTPEDKRAYGNSYHHRKKNDPQYLRNKKNARTRLRYGITLEELESMHMAQNNACKICGVTGKKLVVDHCHDTGLVRGLLCYSCNIKLSGMEDGSWAERARGYLHG